MDTTDGVKRFLSRLGLDQYYEMFLAKGFDTESDVSFLNPDALDSMYIVDQTDRSKLLQAAPNFKVSKEFVLYEWLREKGLDHYYISFVQSELVDLVDIGRLNLPDEQLYDELEITLPGHKRRLERAVRQLTKKHRTVIPSVAAGPGDDTDPSRDVMALPADGADTELPVAYGRWGKPRCLVDAKYDFLILDATVVSTNDPRDKVELEFMVDSGSDVVTIRQEVLDTMDLELIGPIRSKGVHSSRTKNLYRANIVVGSQTLEIEVMGESYDSIGSRVIRHFRHYICGSRHIWLKGDFLDPTMSPKSSQSSSSQETHTTSTETVPTSQDISDQSLPSSQDHVPSLPTMPPEHSSQPEETNEEVHMQGTITQEHDSVNITFDPKIQKDYVKVKTDTVEYALDSIEKEQMSNHIGFTFSKKADVGETDINSSQTDETDRIQCDNNEIIDVRSMIAANRKRRASDIAGFDPRSALHDVDREFKRDRKMLQGDLNMIRTVGANNNEYAHVAAVVKDNNNKLLTVLNKRCIYYTSQVTESKNTKD